MREGYIQEKLMPKSKKQKPQHGFKSLMGSMGISW